MDYPSLLKKIKKKEGGKMKSKMTTEEFDYKGFVMDDKEKRFDELFNKYATISMDALQENKQLQDVFRINLLLSFPPKGLPPAFTVVSTKNKPIDLEEITEKFSPYYSWTITKNIRQEKKTLKMKLNKKHMKHRKVFLDLDLIRDIKGDS